MTQPTAASRDVLAPPVAATAFGETLDWREIPVFVVNRNRLGALRRLVDWLCAAGTRRVVIMDNASDYPPLLQYYEQLPEGVKVMRLAENHGPYVLWQQGVNKVLDTPYVVTDSDVVPADFCPPDLIAVLLDRLRRWPDAKKVGMALRIDNLPDCYGEADTVRKWESQFWEHPVAPGAFAAPIDTTFALYPARGEFSNEACNVRLGHPYIAEHTPWYVDENALGAEELYYREHTSATFSNWSVAKKDSWVKKSERVAGFSQRAQILHVDGGREYIPGWINAGSGAGRCDIDFDPERCRDRGLPLKDDALDGIHLSHVLEGVRDAQALFDELYRVAKPNAELFIRVLPGARDDAWQHPGQQRAWHEGSFAFFSQTALPVGGGGYTGDWEVKAIRLVDVPGSARELVVTLRAVKPGRPRGGARPVRQVEALPVSDARIDPSFAIATSAASHPAIRLGLPWRLQHYVAMNGPHPLVQSFLQGNKAVEAVELESTAQVTRRQQQAIVLRMTEQARMIPHETTAAYIESLDPQDQMVVEAQVAHYEALFLHTAPLYAGTRPWLFHFESFPSLFMPFMYTGRTTDVDLLAQGFFKLVRTNLESPQCLRIFSHMRGSLEILKRTFDSPAIAAKCRHVPLGISPVAPADAMAKYQQPGLRILFTNSLHQLPSSFYLRGGHHLLEAFARLREHLPDMTLTVLSSVPPDLLERFTPAQLSGVRWIETRVDDAALERLYLDHHLFALPAAGLHSYSLLRALAHGCVPIVSDAPGYEEYTQGIEDSVLTVRGVRAQVYRDEPSGWISDRYAPFLARSESFVQQIHDQVLESRGLPTLREMAQRNLAHCRRHFSLVDSQAAFNRLLPVA